MNKPVSGDGPPIARIWSPRRASCSHDGKIYPCCQSWWQFSTTQMQGASGGVDTPRNSFQATIWLVEGRALGGFCAVVVPRCTKCSRRGFKPHLRLVGQDSDHAQRLCSDIGLLHQFLCRPGGYLPAQARVMHHNVSSYNVHGSSNGNRGLINCVSPWCKPPIAAISSCRHGCRETA